MCDDLVGLTEIGKKCGVRGNAVSNWTVRFADFPPPVAMLSSGSVYRWRDIERWLKKNKPHYLKEAS